MKVMSIPIHYDQEFEVQVLLVSKICPLCSGCNLWPSVTQVVSEQYKLSWQLG